MRTVGNGRELGAIAGPVSIRRCSSCSHESSERFVTTSRCTYAVASLSSCRTYVPPLFMCTPGKTTKWAQPEFQGENKKKG